jgi:hypothetical protein
MEEALSFHPYKASTGYSEPGGMVKLAPVKPS